MSASGSVEQPKQFPAATMDDQDMIASGNEEGEVEGQIVLGAPPFSSPNPQTDGQKMLPLEDGTSAYQSAADSAERRDRENLTGVKKDQLVEIAESEDVPLPEGKDEWKQVKADDIRDAIKQNRTSGMTAADFIQKVKDAPDQEALDAAASDYEDSGKQYTTVDTAIEKRQEELNAAGDDDDNDNQ